MQIYDAAPVCKSRCCVEYLRSTVQNKEQAMQSKYQLAEVVSTFEDNNLSKFFKLFVSMKLVGYFLVGKS